ncbi:hypothetical protein ACLOJK_016476 [Asimina triloba]
MESSVKLPMLHRYITLCLCFSFLLLMIDRHSISSPPLFVRVAFDFRRVFFSGFARERSSDVSGDGNAWMHQMFESFAVVTEVRAFIASMEFRCCSIQMKHLVSLCEASCFVVWLTDGAVDDANGLDYLKVGPNARDPHLRTASILGVAIHHFLLLYQTAVRKLQLGSLSCPHGKAYLVIAPKCDTRLEWDWIEANSQLKLIASVLRIGCPVAFACSREPHVNRWWDSLDYDACQPVSSNDASLQDLLFGDASSAYIRGNSPGYSAIKSICMDSGLFCFPSTLPGFCGQDHCRESENSNDSVLNEVSIQHSIRENNFSWNVDHATIALSNGRKISCSLNSVWESSYWLPLVDGDFDHNGFDSCKGPSVPRVSVQKPSNPTSPSDKNAKETASDLFNVSSLLHVSISPPLLDWGLNHLYVPSLAFLTVANTCNDSILHIYRPFSTDPQFYTYEFEEASLAPGKASTIAFAFSPRWLGPSSAHLVLQTSSGGFLIKAKGVGIESPYRVQPILGLDISSDGRLRKNLSLHNPFNDDLFVEEIAAWVTVSSDNASHNAHVACRVDTSHAHDQFDSSLSVKEWLNLKTEMGLRLMGIKPYGKWEVGPQKTEIIMEIDMSYVDGRASGAFCLQLRNFSSDRTDMVIVPLEAEVHGRVAYKSLTGSVSVFLDTAMACDDKGSVAVTLSLRNSASYLLSVVKISEVTENMELFQVKYMEGLILYPGTETHIAVVVYTPTHDSQSYPTGIPSINWKSCKLLIATNDSSNPHIEIPCQDIVHSCLRIHSDDAFTSSWSLDSQQEEESTINESVESVIQGPSLIKWKVSDIAEADELILRNWRSQGISNGMSILEDHELLFPMVQVGSHHSEWIHVNNPSGDPVIMQLVLNSGSIVDHCGGSSQALYDPFSSSFGHDDYISNKDGFSIMEAAVTQAYVHPYSRAVLGPIVFHPSDRCTWQSSALIRNNLSGVEWLHLRGSGGSLSLVLLEGSEPVRHLEFSLEVPSPPNTSPLGLQDTSSLCVQPLSKDIYVKNIGDLPVEVRRLEVSGTACGLDGFMIQTCKGFALEPGESIRLLISFQTDFSASVVHRDLELALAAGVLVIPMKAILPANMLNLCRKTMFWMLFMKLSVVVLVILVAATVTFVMFFRILPQAMVSGTGEYFSRSERNAISTVSRIDKTSRAHRKQRNARLLKEGEKPEMGFVTGYVDHLNSVQELGTKQSKKMQDEQAGIPTCMDHQKETPLLSSSVAKSKSTEVSENAVAMESPQSGKLTVRIERERGRRRKRRAHGASPGLTGKLEVSSSQSGNSTPSSPLSPVTSFTPKRSWPLSSDVENSFEGLEHPFEGGAKRKHEKEHGFKTSGEASLKESAISFKRYDTSLSYSVPEQHPAPVKLVRGRPVLLPSATFPVTGWRAPGLVGTSPFVGSSSTIAPPARAPGFKAIKEEPVQPKGNVELEEKFTYDIWGNHFSEFHLMGKHREISGEVSDASVGNSQSFFLMGPQSLKQMTPERAVSPDPMLGRSVFAAPELPIYAVNSHHQMK